MANLNSSSPNPLSVSPELVSSLRKIIRFHARTPEDIEDILQVVFLKILKNGDKVDASKFMPWLQKVCRTTAIDFYRKQKKSVPLAQEHLNSLIETQNDDENETPQKLAQCLRPMLKKLSAEDSNLLSKVELESESQINIAKKMGIPYSSFKSKVQRARTKLKEAVLDCCDVEFDRNNHPIEMKLRKKSCS